jgi:hypothetical protein
MTERAIGRIYIDGEVLPDTFALQPMDDLPVIELEAYYNTWVEVWLPYTIHLAPEQQEGRRRGEWLKVERYRG